MKRLVSRYLKLWLAFFRNTLSRDMEFKFDFILELFIDAIYYGSLFFYFHVILGIHSTFGDFGKEEIIIFLILLYLVDSTYGFFLGGNTFSINEKVKSGDLDFILIRPINPQFFLSFRYVNTPMLVSISILSILLFKLVLEYHDGNIEILKYLLCMFSMVMGIIIFYSFEFIIACFVFWFRNFSYAGWLSGELIKYSRKPDSIYKTYFRKILLSLFPMAMIVSVPARLLLFETNYTLLLIQIIVAGIFLSLSIFTWNKGLKVYESASS